MRDSDTTHQVKKQSGHWFCRRRYSKFFISTNGHVCHLDHVSLSIWLFFLSLKSHIGVNWNENCHIWSSFAKKDFKIFPGDPCLKFLKDHDIYYSKGLKSTHSHIIDNTATVKSTFYSFSLSTAYRTKFGLAIKQVIINLG